MYLQNYKKLLKYSKFYRLNCCKNNDLSYKFFQKDKMQLERAP